MDKFKNIPPVYRFIIYFLISLIVISIIFSQVFTRYHDNFVWMMELTAFLSGGAIDIFSDKVYCDGVFVTYDSFPVEIIDACTGLFEMLIYLAAVFSFSTSFRNKLLGAALGLPAIYIFNVLRIIVLLIVGASSMSAFHFMHLYLWQVILIMVIAGVWIGWLYLVVFREKR